MPTENEKMRKLLETRRKNLLAVLDASGKGSRKELAEQMKWSNASRVSQILRADAIEHPKWQINEKLAREIEAALHLDWGFLDHVHANTDPNRVVRIGRAEVSEVPESTTGVPPDPKKLEQVLTAITSIAAKLQLPLQPSDLAQITAFVYSHSPRSGGIDEAFVRQLLKIVKK